MKIDGKAKALQSLCLGAWRNIFTGGFPGGEVFLNAWIEGGMQEDIPELYPELQPSAGIKPERKVDQICYPYLGLCLDIDWDEALEKAAPI